MKTSELRIGNCVMAKSPESTEWVEGYMVSAYTLYAMTYSNSMGFVKPDLKPIPLTEEWLMENIE